jgi:D-lactate dehydrogenase
MHVIAYDLYPNHDQATTLGFTYTDLEHIYTQSDIISLHCPLTPETQHCINTQTVASMKDGVMIINTGRGMLIDTQALIA